MPEPIVNPLLLHKSQLGGTEETTPGTPAAVAAVLASTLVFNAKIRKVDPMAGGERFATGLGGAPKSYLPGQEIGELTFRVQVHYGDKTLPMLTGCGYYLDTGTYKPTTNFTNRKCWSFKLWQDGMIYGLAGAAGNVVFTADAGGPLWADFTFRGIWQTPVDGAMVTDSYPTVFPYRAMSGTATLAAAVLPGFQTFRCDLGNTIAKRSAHTQTNGIAHFYVATPRRPRITLDPEARLVASLDNFGILALGTQSALVYAIKDSQAPQKTLTFSAPKVQRIDVDNTQERDSLQLHGLTLACCTSTADDELTLAEA